MTHLAHSNEMSEFFFSQIASPHDQLARNLVVFTGQEAGNGRRRRRKIHKATLGIESQVDKPRSFALFLFG